VGEGGLRALREALAAEGGLVAASLRRPEPGHESPGGELEPSPPRVAALGPRTRERAAEYELLLEMIYEGSELHYGRPRVLDGEDRDLALLLGDQLYALGLLRLAEIGDLEAVIELADMISLVAQAAAQGDRPLVEEIWRSGAQAIGWGSTPEHVTAKALAREGDPRAAGALRAARHDRDRDG
jgi:hypothetical protein